MPFYTPANETYQPIDLNRYKPIVVIAYYDIDGNIKPLRFKYESDFTFNINEIKYSKDVKGGILFCCLITNCNKQQEVNLVYFIREHLWCLEI